MSPGPRRGFIGIAVLVTLLQVLPATPLVDSAYLPPLGDMLVALWEQAGTAMFWVALGDTMLTWATGLAIALLGGIVAGVLIGTVPGLRVATASTIEFLRPIPSVALIPLAVLMFGTTRDATLLLIVYASFWQVLVQILDGVRDVDPVADETARSYRFGTVTRIRRLVWPTALPYALTGVRLAATVALVLAITGELVIGSPGLGQQIALAQSAGAVPAMYGLVIVTGVLGVAVSLAVRTIERRCLRWHVSVRREALA